MNELPPYVTDEKINWFIENALREDVETGDHTSLATIEPDSRSRAILKVKDYGRLAGVEMARRIFQKIDPTCELIFHFNDGRDVVYGEVAFEVVANTRALLQAERLVLNTMQRMSGIATLASRFAFEVADLPVKILDTRKTTPLVRFYEKWAVKIGGCENYRFGLFDRLMIKDNHVEAAGGVAEALERAHNYVKINDLNLEITLEVRNLNELREALEVGGFNRLMLDNFEIPLLAEGVEIVDRRFETEASGGVNLYSVRRIAMTGVDFISAGALTHSAQPLDLSLKIVSGETGEK